jgi:hypothetical protein
MMGPCRRWPLPSDSWPVLPFLHCASREEQVRHPATGSEAEAGDSSYVWKASGHSMRPWKNHRVGGRQANRRIFHRAAESEWLVIMEESAPTQTEEESISSLRVGAVGAPATLGNFACTDRKKKMAVRQFATREEQPYGWSTVTCTPIYK